MSGNIQAISNAMKQKGTRQSTQPTTGQPDQSNSNQTGQNQPKVAALQAKFIPAMGEIRIPKPKLTPSATCQEGHGAEPSNIQGTMGAGDSESDEESSKEEETGGQIRITE
ncbi:hypothetical protein PCASD_19914 [Puccinia coronata f. sp. avenae]|uniref:Uncharacterized protein n=1 Tax=Puccinia coronata f. sp. avenae TaxID=200324 RepID=A0A2N5U7S1_9BASI|nr:hypothetical protein PCASD_19914 [Puccinia coronata f. sp. avenae]